MERLYIENYKTTTRSFKIAYFKRIRNVLNKTSACEMELTGDPLDTPQRMLEIAKEQALLDEFYELSEILRDFEEWYETNK